MEDLRDEKKKNKEEGKKPSTTTSEKWVIINAVLFKIYTRTLFVFKTYKYFWIAIGIILLALFPIEIGLFIGDWSFFFWTGLIKNFK